MTLAQLTDYVCQKSGLTESDDQTACRGFLSKRYELIYNQYLWKDTLVAVDVTVDPTNADNAEGVVFVPEVIDRVVAVRTPTNSVRIHGLEDYYRIDFDRFSNQGVATEFALLSPVWFVWRGYNGLSFSAAQADIVQNVKVTWRNTSGIRFVLTSPLSGLSLNDSSGVLDTNTIYVSGAGWVDANGLYFLSGNGRYYKNGNSTNKPYYEIFGTSLILRGQFNDSILYIGSGGSWTTIDGTAPPPIATNPLKCRIEIESVFKPTTSAAVSLNPQIGGDNAGGTLQATDTRSPAYQRIRLFNIPTIEIVLSILGKKKFVPLDFDQEEPAIKNLDNCLIAFAMGDMLKRARQFGKAQSELQEGGLLLSELAKLEVLQAANNVRFIPDNGYGDCYFSATGRGFDYF